MNIERFSLESLKPHPLNAKIYGAAEPDQALIQSIEAIGILNAIIVDQKGRILSGTRRWKACKALTERHRNEKFSQIPTEVFKGNDLEAQRRLIHANRQRDKSLEQKTREYREMLRLETELARQRMIATLKKGAKAPAREKFPERGRAADIAAKATGLNAKTLNRFLKVVEAADAGHAEARALVDKVNTNCCAPTTAYDRIFPEIGTSTRGPVESELAMLLGNLTADLAALTKFLKVNHVLNGRKKTQARGLVASLKKFSKDTGEGADRLEDALRIAALRRTKKLDISKNVPIFSWLNKTHCGDCIAVMEKMPVHSVGLIVTSPPYNLHAGKGMKFCSSKWQKLVQQGYQSSDDAMPHEKYVKWQRSCLASMMRVLRDDGAIFYNHKWRVQNGLLQDRSEIVQGFPVRQVIIWHRNGGVNFNPGYFLPRFEIIYLICKPAFKLVPGANAIGDVWNIARDDDAQHPHPFPVELAERCIQSTSAKVVLDPFIGSGSTAVAAENLKRHWIGIDVSREYCEMADRRIRRRGRQSPVEGVQEIRGGALPSREVRSPAEMTAQARRV